MAKRFYNGRLSPTLKGHVKQIEAEQTLRKRLFPDNRTSVQERTETLAIAIDTARRGNNSLFLLQKWALKNKIGTTSPEIATLRDHLLQAKNPTDVRAELIRVLKIKPEQLAELDDWLKKVAEANKTQKEMINFFGKGGTGTKIKRVGVRGGKVVGYTRGSGPYDDWVRRRTGKETAPLDRPKK